MDIFLINYTKDGLKTIARAVRITGPFFKKTSDSDLVRSMTKHGFGSTLEHISFTFELRDITIALSRELLEHRIASHTAKSTRYASQAKELSVYVPPKIKEDAEELSNFLSFIGGVHMYYQYLEKKYDRESARYVLPMALQCTYTWTINARSLINFLRLRLCVLAAPEMQELAHKVYDLVNEVYPEIFDNIGCRGSQYEVCPEPKGRSCGKYRSVDTPFWDWMDPVVKIEPKTIRQVTFKVIKVERGKPVVCLK